MREQRPSWTSPLIPLQPAAIDCLSRNNITENTPFISGIAKNGTVSWLCRQSALEVFSSHNGDRLAAWCFGAALRERGVCVSAVSELGAAARWLLVATYIPNGAADAGAVHLFDVRASRVVKSIDLPFMVTSIEPIVSSDKEAGILRPLLSEHLRCFSGIAALGTHCGHIYLVDLCLDSEELSDELSPASLHFVDPRSHDVPHQRTAALKRGKHLCLPLGESGHGGGYFQLRKPDHSVVRTYAADEVCVSALRLLPHTGLLAVGFNFGCFQLWRLNVPLLEYTSRFEDDLAPVTHFAYQEPENDPRNFCYMWVARGPMVTDAIDDYVSSLTLFQLGYNRKLWIEDFGFLFEELCAVGPRFEHDLCSADSPDDSTVAGGSRLLGCVTLTDPNYVVPEKSADESFETGFGGRDLSLCVFVWEASLGDPTTSTQCMLGMFDMNRWYHAQMPGSIRPCAAGSAFQCPYFSLCSLDAAGSADRPVMAAYVPHASLARFRSTAVVPAPEQHFYPSALAFDVCCVLESGIIHTKFLGFQRQMLSDLCVSGPGCLADPADVYNLFLCAGLLPRSQHDPAVSAVCHKREALLSCCLDHGLVGFVTGCVREWAAGELAGVGCSTRMLLDWAWKQVSRIKPYTDSLCKSLYDWSGQQLDNQTLQILHHQQTVLGHLVSVLGALAGVLGEEVGVRLAVVTLIHQHLTMVLWFYQAGLLPEHAESEELSGEQFAFPAKVLKDAYSKRRTEISQLHSGVSASDVLMIDGLVEAAGQPLHTLWENTSGCPQYPPNSFYALLNIYLLEGVSVESKHQLMFYALCDLYNLLPDDKQQKFHESVLSAWAACFGMLPAATRLIQGLFLLDHRCHDDALGYLLDPAVTPAPWQHTRVLKSCLYQGEASLALRYLRVKRPLLSAPADRKLALTVLLANRLVPDAVELTRCLTRGDGGDEEDTRADFLQHIFAGCQQTKSLDQLVTLPLFGGEEKQLLEQLRTSSDRRGQELLVLYYLQRARFVEAIRLNNTLKATSDPDAGWRQRAVTRNAIVDGYQRVLPTVQRKLSLASDSALQKRAKARREFTRPTPLSTVVNRARHRATSITTATLLQSVLDRVTEVTAGVNSDLEEEDEEEEGLMAARNRIRLQQPSSSDSAPDDAGPFVCTPKTPRYERGVSAATSLLYPTMQQPHDAAGISYTSAASPVAPPTSQLPWLQHASPAATASPWKQQKSRLPADVATLLQTPPVRRKSPSSRRSEAAIPTPVKTPHSILKVRHKPVRRSPSPARMLTGGATVNARISSAADLAVPSPPRVLVRKSIHEAIYAAAAEAENDTTASEAEVQPTPPGTPTKHLRFVEPEKDEEEADSGGGLQAAARAAASVLQNPRVRMLKSVHDRSPTPERKNTKSALERPPLDTVRTSPDKPANVDFMFTTQDDDVPDVGSDLNAASSSKKEASDEEESNSQNEDVVDSEIEMIVDGEDIIVDRGEEPQAQQEEEEEDTVFVDSDGTSSLKPVATTSAEEEEMETDTEAQETDAKTTKTEAVIIDESDDEKSDQSDDLKPSTAEEENRMNLNDELEISMSDEWKKCDQSDDEASNQSESDKSEEEKDEDQMFLSLEESDQEAAEPVADSGEGLVEQDAEDEQVSSDEEEKRLKELKTPSVLFSERVSESRTSSTVVMETNRSSVSSVTSFWSMNTTKIVTNDDVTTTENARKSVETVVQPVANEESASDGDEMEVEPICESDAPKTQLHESSEPAESETQGHRVSTTSETTENDTFKLKDELPKQPTSEETEEPISEEVAESSTQNEPVREELVDSSAQDEPIREEVAESSAQNEPNREEVADSSTQDEPIREEVAESSIQDEPIREEVAESSAQNEPNREEVADSSTQDVPIMEEVADSSTQDEPITEEVAESSTQDETIREEVSEMEPLEQETGNEELVNEDKKSMDERADNILEEASSAENGAEADNVLETEAMEGNAQSCDELVKESVEPMESIEEETVEQPMVNVPEVESSSPQYSPPRTRSRTHSETSSVHGAETDTLKRLEELDAEISPIVEEESLVVRATQSHHQLRSSSREPSPPRSRSHGDLHPSRETRARTPTRSLDATYTVSTETEEPNVRQTRSRTNSQSVESVTMETEEDNRPRTRARTPTRAIESDATETAEQNVRQTRSRTPTRTMVEAGAMETEDDRLSQKSESSQHAIDSKSLPEVTILVTPLTSPDIRAATQPRTQQNKETEAEETDQMEVSEASTSTARVTRARTPTRKLETEEVIEAEETTSTARVTHAHTPTRKLETEAEETTSTARVTRARTPTRKIDTEEVIEAIETMSTARVTRARTPTRKVEAEEVIEAEEMTSTARVTRARTPTRKIETEEVPKVTIVVTPLTSPDIRAATQPRTQQNKETEAEETEQMEVSEPSTSTARVTRARTPTRKIDTEEVIEAIETMSKARVTRARTPTRKLETEEVVEAEETTSTARVTRARTPTRKIETDVSNDDQPTTRVTRAKTPPRTNATGVEAEPAVARTPSRQRPSTPSRTVEAEASEDDVPAARRATRATTPTRRLQVEEGVVTATAAESPRRQTRRAAAATPTKTPSRRGRRSVAVKQQATPEADDEEQTVSEATMATPPRPSQSRTIEVVEMKIKRSPARVTRSRHADVGATDDDEDGSDSKQEKPTTATSTRRPRKSMATPKSPVRGKKQADESESATVATTKSPARRNRKSMVAEPASLVAATDDGSPGNSMARDPVVKRSSRRQTRGTSESMETDAASTTSQRRQTRRKTHKSDSPTTSSQGSVGLRSRDPSPAGSTASHDVPSADAADDETRTSQTKAEDEEEEEPMEMEFSFSNPVALERADDDSKDGVPESAPVHAFIFSPPLTRGKRRESLAVTPTRAASPLLGGVSHPILPQIAEVRAGELPSPGASSSAPASPRPGGSRRRQQPAAAAAKPAKARRKRSVVSSVTDSPLDEVRLLPESPVGSEDTPPQHPATRSGGRLLRRPTNPLTLRSRRFGNRLKSKPQPPKSAK